MFKCLNCNKSFETAEWTREFVGEAWGVPQYENTKGCPYCKDTEIERVEEE